LRAVFFSNGAQSFPHPLQSGLSRNLLPSDSRGQGTPFYRFQPAAEGTGHPVRSEERSVVPPAVCVGKSKSARVADKVAVNGMIVARLYAHHPAVMGVGNRIASKRALVAKRGRSLEVPSSHFEPGGFVGVDACGADIDQVSRKRAFERAVGKPAKIHAVPDLERSKVFVSCILLVEPGTAVAMDAPVHFMLNVRSQVLVPIGSLPAPESADAVPAGHCFVLKQALPALVANGTIQGMIHHQQFDHPLAELNRLPVGCRNNHPILRIDHATHLYALERPLEKLDRAHPACSNRSQRLVIAKARNYDAQPFGGVDDFTSLGDFYFKIVND
jgi:hypothetical protein